MIVIVSSRLQFRFTESHSGPDPLGPSEQGIPTAVQAKKLPVVLSQEEVAHFLRHHRQPGASGDLTVCSCDRAARFAKRVRLRARRNNSGAWYEDANRAKAPKNRCVMLPPKLLSILQDYWRPPVPESGLFPGPRAREPLSPLTVDRTAGR